MAKNTDPNNPYKDRGPNPFDKHAKKYGGGDGLELDAKLNSPANQATIDARGPNYANDTKGWVRGKGSPYPNFDSGPSGSRYEKRR
jgi:hypothetical protein